MFDAITRLLGRAGRTVRPIGAPAPAGSGAMSFGTPVGPGRSRAAVVRDDQEGGRGAAIETKMPAMVVMLTHAPQRTPPMASSPGRPPVDPKEPSPAPDTSVDAFPPPHRTAKRRSRGEPATPKKTKGLPERSKHTAGQPYLDGSLDVPSRSLADNRFSTGKLP